MKRVKALLLVTVALSGVVLAQSPPPQIIRTDSGLVPVQVSMPVYWSADGNLWRIDSNGVFQTADSNVSVTWMTKMTAAGGMWLNSVKIWPNLSSPTPGQAVKVMADSSIGFGADLTGSPFFDTVNAVNISYVNAAGDTVMGAYLIGPMTYLYNNSGTSYFAGSQFFIPILTLDSANLASAVASARVRTNDLYGISGALDFRAPSGQAMTFQQGISGNINWYYGALLYMALEAGILDGQNRSGLRDFLYGEFDSSITVEGTLGTGYLGSDSINARGQLGIDGDYISSWADISGKNADSLDDIPVDFSALTNGDLAYYDGTNLTGARIVVKDSIPDSTAVFTHEKVQDLVGAMFSGNTETNVAVTYQDADGTIDVEVTGSVGGGLLAWGGVDTLAHLIDSVGDTILQVERQGTKTRLKAEDGDEIVVGDSTAYSRSPHGIITPTITLGVPADTANSDSSAASQHYSDTWGGDWVMLAFRTVRSEPSADDDSVVVQDNVRRILDVVLFRDSTWEGSDLNNVGIIIDIPYDFDCDSLIFEYLTNGSIDSLHLYNSDATAGDIAPDSAYYKYETALTATTKTRVGIQWNRNFTAGEMAQVQFYDNLADDNDRTVVHRAWLKGKKR